MLPVSHRRNRSMTNDFERLIQTFPAEALVDEDDPDYPNFEADSGCRVCASGQPCQERIRNDINDILTASSLPRTDKIACLQWMIEEGRSSLTHSITQMAEEFTHFRQQADAALIAAQNDAFRQQAGLPGPVIFAEAKITGIVVLRPEVNALSPWDKAAILRKVREFNGWTPDNDPYGEHDFGVIEHEGERLFFKFDYYDRQFEYGSEHPASLAETARMLTIRMAREY